jgi:zinc protease
MTLTAPEWKSLPGPERITRAVLSNGAVVLVFSNLNAPSVHIVGLLETGSVADPLGRLGLANFTAAMLSRGTRQRPFTDFHRELESMGASLAFSCGTRGTWLRGKALAEDAGTLFDLARDGLSEPSFAADYVERTRKQLLAGLAIRDQDTDEAASLLFDETLFPGHPYAHPTDGFSPDIQAITRADLLAFHNGFYRPQGMLIAVSGALETGRAVELAENTFGSWKKTGGQSQAIPSLPPAPAGIIRRHRFIAEKSQADLIMGTLSPARLSEDYLPVMVGNNILGQFGLMGRIGASVRSKAGLAYHASSNITGWQDAGTWEFGAGCDPKNLEKTIRLIRREIKRFVSERVTSEELNDTQSHLVGRLPLSLESNAGLASALINMERFNLGLDYYQRYPEMIQKVSTDQILESARCYLHPDRLVIASAGPGEDIP